MHCLEKSNNNLFLIDLRLCQGNNAHLVLKVRMKSGNINSPLFVLVNFYRLAPCLSYRKKFGILHVTTKNKNPLNGLVQVKYISS